ncbi:MAG: AsmA-like C-terminal region-containing protein [Odoribacter sp.]
MMKKVLITLGIIIVLLIATLLILPTFFKGDILRIIQNQSSRYIKAELKIEDMSLSMFKSFPDLNISLTNISITGQNEFAGDTIVYVPLFEASVNLKSLFSGNELLINRILIQDTRLIAAVDTSGNQNWNILIADDSTAQETATPTPDTQATEKGLRFNDLSIENLYIAYNDFKSSTYASIADIDLKLKGNLSEKNTLINVLLSLNNISLRQQNSVWINQTNLNWQAEIAANLQDQIFDIKKNNLLINDLQLDLTGNVAIKDDKYKLDLQLNAPDTKFESLLALVPKTFQHYIEGLKANGDFKLNATAKGEYYENHLPAFQMNLLVNDASVQYTKLPESIQKINIDLHINNPGGSTDSTSINLKKMSFNIAGNPFNMFLTIVNPNDPLLQGGAVGVINFASLKKALPLKDITLQGIITTDVTFNGKYQYIEKEEYEKFIAKGNILFKDILFVNTDFPQGISIPQGSIVITPARLNLNKLQAQIYSSDFMLQGYISNYLPYFFKNAILKGNFSLTSKQINLNEFIIAQTQTAKKDTTATKTDSLANQQTANGKPSAAEGVLEMPKNIDIQFSTNIGNILFDQLKINKVQGNISLKNAVATLQNLSMNLLNGTLVLNGKYSTADPKTPTVDFNLNASEFDINATYHSFSFIKKSIPIVMDCNGKISAAMKFSAILDKEMSPIMNTANGQGFIESKGIMINDNPAMNQLAGILKNEELSRLSISQLKINFKLENGNITVEPFKTTLAGNPITIYGNQSVDGKLDYTLSINVNRKVFGKDINNLLKSIPGSSNIENLDIDVKVNGTLTDPSIKPDLSKAIKAVTKAAEKELKGKVLKGLEGLFKKK